jgi:hypothetical protein
LGVGDTVEDGKGLDLFIFSPPLQKGGWGCARSLGECGTGFSGLRCAVLIRFGVTGAYVYLVFLLYDVHSVLGGCTRMYRSIMTVWYVGTYRVTQYHCGLHEQPPFSALYM